MGIISIKPTLQFIPSAYKTIRNYSNLPTDGVGDWDFGRSSIKSRITSAGLIETMPSNILRPEYEDGLTIMSEKAPVWRLDDVATNLVLRNQDLTNASWVKSGSTILTPNFGTGPDGVANSSTKIDFTGTSEFVNQVVSGITLTNTFSGHFWIKGTASQTITLGFGAAEATFVLDGNWQRINSDNFTATTQTISMNTFGGATATVIEYFACQVESGATSTPTIYPTLGSSVTRSQDVLANAGDSTTFNSLEGGLRVKMAALSDDGTIRSMSISDGTVNNRVELTYSSTSNSIIARVRVSGVTQANMSFIASDVTNMTEIFVKWGEDDFALWVDGIERASDNSGSVPPASTFNRAGANSGAGADNLFAKIAIWEVYSEKLSDANIIKLQS